MPIWTLREAQSRFAEIVDQALQGAPQIVTGQGEEAVVVVAYRDFAGLKTELGFKEFLLSVPKVDVESGPSTPPRKGQ